MPTNAVEKLKNLILYLSQKSQQDEKFGSTKLNKLLFYSDFEFYRRHLKSITGSEYQKLKAGPAPRAMARVLHEMRQSGHLRLDRKSFFSFTQKVPVPLAEPDMSCFSEEEIKTVDSVLDRFRDHNGGEISGHAYREFRLSHYEDGETISYNISLVGTRQPTAEDIQWAEDNRLEEQALAWHNSRHAAS